MLAVVLSIKLNSWIDLFIVLFAAFLSDIKLREANRSTKLYVQRCHWGAQQQVEARDWEAAGAASRDGEVGALCHASVALVACATSVNSAWPHDLERIFQLRT